MSFLNKDQHHHELVGDGETTGYVADTAISQAPGLGDVAVLFGGIKGRWANKFIELNQEHLYIPPTDNKEPSRWRGQLPSSVRLDDAILCHSFLKLPIGRKGWRHGAETSSSRSRRERPRDMLYPMNAKSGISNLMFCVDYAPGPDMRPAVRIISQVRKPPIRIETEQQSLLLSSDCESEILEKPAKIYLSDNDPDCLSFWMWSPTRNAAEQKGFNEHVRAFIDRSNRLDEAEFPGLESAGGSTLAPSPSTYEPPKPRAIQTRTGLTGMEYKRCGEIISSGACRDVFPVEITHRPGSNLDVPEQTVMQERQPVANPPEMKLVAKEIKLKGNDAQSKQRFREMLEKEFQFGINNPHPHVNEIIDIAYVPEIDARPWIIEKRQPYCLDSARLPFPLDKKVILLQLLCGVAYYHDNNKMHRDIKPLNVLLEIVLDEDPAAGSVQHRVVVKFTDHGEVVSTDRPVEGIAGTPFYCAPEVLDGQQYGEKADIFSLGILLLRLLTGYDPSRDRSYGGKWPLSSADVQVWMEKVDRILRSECDVDLEPLIRGMLLREPSERWSVGKCLVYMHELEQNEICDETSIGLQLPWGMRPLTAAQIRMGHKRKYEEFERDEVLTTDDGEFNDGRIVTLAASGPLPDGTAIKSDQPNDTILENDEPATPKLSCTVQLPLTPRRGDMWQDGLPSAFCTPIVDNKATSPADGRAPPKPKYYRLSRKCNWDWGSTVDVGGSESLLTRDQPSPGLQLGIFPSNWGCRLNEVLHPDSGDDDGYSEAETVRNVGDSEPDNGSGSEVETVRLMGNETPEPDADDDSETLGDVRDGESKAPLPGRKLAQSKVLVDVRYRNEQPKDLDSPEAFVLPQPSEKWRRKLPGTTKAKRHRKTLEHLSFDTGSSPRAVIR